MVSIQVTTLTMASDGPENPRMMQIGRALPTHSSPVTPSCHSRRVPSLRIHTPTGRCSAVRYRRHALHRCPFPASLRIKIRTQYKHCTRGGGPQILSAFVKQRTYESLPIVNSTHRKLPSHGGESCRSGYLAGRVTARRDNQERIDRTSVHGRLWYPKRNFVRMLRLFPIIIRWPLRGNQPQS